MTTIKRISAILCTVASLLSFSSVSAQSLLKNGPSVFNYNFIDAMYIDDDAFDGLGLGFSADIRDNYALQVAYSRLGAGSLDFDTVSGGVAYHIETAKYPGQADWVFTLGFNTADGDGVDDTGLYAGAGARYAVNDAMEFNGALNLSTIFSTELTLNLKLMYEMVQGFSALVETNIGDGGPELGLGVRFYWR